MPDRDIRSIVEACTRGNGEITELESAVAAGADVNAASDGALRPLMVAVREKRADIVSTLLRLKADPNLPDSKGVSPLHAAIFDDTIDVVQSLIDFNADVHRRDRHGQTPLFFAPTRKACGQLARGKCDVNVRNLKGQSPLHLAAHAGLNDTVLWLVERMTKETINAQDKHGRTAVYCAAHSNLKSTILLLQENGADVQLRPHKYPQMKAKRALEEASRKRIIEARDRAPRSLAIDTTNSETSMRDDLEGQISPKRPMDELRHLQDERNDADPEVLNELENLLKDREGVVADVQVDDFNASNMEEKGWISGKPLTAVGPFIYPMRPFSEYYSANVTPNVPGFLEVLCKRDFPDARKRLEGSIVSRTVMEEEASKKQVVEKIVAGETMAAMKSAEPRIAVETVAVSGGSTASMAEQARLKEEANRKQAEENRAAEEAKAVTKAEEARVAVAATVAAVAVATTVAVDAVAISGEASMPEEARLKDEAARKQVEETRAAEEGRAVTKVEEKTVAVEVVRTTVAVEAAAMIGQASMPEKARLKEEAYRKQVEEGRVAEEAKSVMKAEEATVAVEAAATTVAVEAEAVAMSEQASMPERARYTEKAGGKQVEARVAEEAKSVMKVEEATVAVEAVAMRGEPPMAEQARSNAEAARNQAEDNRAAEQEAKAVVKFEEATVAVEAVSISREASVAEQVRFVEKADQKQAKRVDAVLVTGSSNPLCNGTFRRCTTPTGANNGGRVIYKGPGKKYMFYWSEVEKWMVGDDYNTQKGWLCSTRCETPCPTEASSWKEWNSTSREFQIVESLKVQEKVACANTVIVSGNIAYPSCAGTYVKSGMKPYASHAGRAILKGPGSKYLFYWARINKWVIGDDCASQKGLYCSNHSEGWCPTDASGWKEWDPSLADFKVADAVRVQDAEAYNRAELEQEKKLAEEALARAMKEEEKLTVGEMLLAEEAKAQAMKAEEDERAKDLASTQVSPAKSEVMMKIIKQEDIAQKDQEDAVVKIQKIQRGRSDRMRVEKKRNAIPVGSSDFEGASVWEVPLRKLNGKQKYGFSHTNAKVELLREYTKASMPSAARMPENMIPLDQTLLSDAEYPEALIIKKILDKGLIGDWNFIHPEAEVKPGDRVIEVNGSKTITDMQKQLRTSECICKVLRCPEVFHITLAKQPQRRFGFKFEKPAVLSLRELRITEISKQGLLDEANRANMKMGLHHKVVLPGMRIEAVDEVEGDCFLLAEALRKCNAHVTLRIRRAEFFQMAQKKVGKSALVISAMQLGTGQRMAVPLDTNEVEDRRSP